MIEIKEVVKSFGEVKALNRISLRIDKGQLCILVGSSGSGKSTLLRLINRLLDPDSGEIIIEGKSNRLEDPVELRRRIGYAIQGVGLFPHMTVYQNIALVPEILKWSRERTEQRVNDLLELIGLTRSFLGRYPSQLSGGEAQRVGVARALAADPQILLMDEPFGALDRVTRNKLQREFLQIQQELKKTILFVTHDIEEAFRLADNVALLEKGRIAQQGKPEDFIRRPANDFIREFTGDPLFLEYVLKQRNP
jgi:osmoprotectant transport system ATP-binding protein